MRCRRTYVLNNNNIEKEIQTSIDDYLKNGLHELTRVLDLYSKLSVIN